MNSLRQKIFPDVVIFSAFIDGPCKEGQWQEATKVLDVMLDKGYNLNAIT
jgi:pentatricopeptide repeat protein